MPTDRAQLLTAACVAVSLAACLTYNYMTHIERPNLQRRVELHREILRGQAPSPFRYRLLVPLAAEAGARALGATGLVGPGWALSLAYVAHNLVALTAFFLALFYFLRRFHAPPLALLGVLFVGALLPVTLRDHYFQPWSLLEAALFGLAYLCTASGRSWPLWPLTLLACLNRSTGVFLPVIFLLGALQPLRPGRGWLRANRGALARGVGLLALAAAVLLGLRLSQGQSPHVHSLAHFWAQNTSAGALLKAGLHWAIFFGAGWLLLPRGLSQAPPALRRLLWLVPLYLVPVFLFGIWREVRLLLPLYPLLAAVALFPLGRLLRGGPSAGG